ncbi:MAG: hypothetical protein K6E34_01775, partial [Lachnospiraceae bacterium]|nr:hypothetical protein [Lachnospiraceae bacterium]
AEAILGKRLGFILRLTFVFIGAVVYYLVYVFVLWLKFPADDMKLLTAIVVATFLAVPYLKNLRNTSFTALARRNARGEADAKGAGQTGGGDN